MTLNLDATQRVNLHVVLGAQRVHVDAIRTIWRIQDRIALTAEEEAAIGLKRVVTEQGEQIQWTAGKTLPLNEFEFSDAEILQLRESLKQLAFLGNDRKWLAPILDSVMPEKGETK